MFCVSCGKGLMPEDARTSDRAAECSGGGTGMDGNVSCRWGRVGAPGLAGSRYGVGTQVR